MFLKASARYVIPVSWRARLQIEVETEATPDLNDRFENRAQSSVSENDRIFLDFSISLDFNQ